MSLADLDEVVGIENVSFPTPWKREHFLHEMKRNPHAWCVVLESRDSVVAYAATWILVDEVHVNEIAVRPDLRGRGVGRRFLARILEEARKMGCKRACLEVRPSNRSARKMYENLGFRETDLRRGYYSDTGEDALVLTADLSAV
jgi:ribosomal-protein-alanine N-acetyltransferase